MAEIWIHSLTPTDRDRQSYDPPQAMKGRVLHPLQTVADRVWNHHKSWWTPFMDRHSNY